MSGLTDGYRELFDLRTRGDELAEERRQIDQRLRAMSTGCAEQKPQPIGKDDRSQNRLRPQRLAEVVGQDRAKSMMARVVQAARERGEPLDHALLVGPAGTGKTTFANVIANELGRDCYQLAAPVSLESLLELREVMQPGDILFVDEIHMQAVQERRGKEAMSAPEVFLTLLEDFVLATGDGMIPFPQVTVIGATTDPGRLPDPFLDRFPLQPRLETYSKRELSVIGAHNATALNISLAPGVADLFAGAARGTPRLVNNYMKNATALTGADRHVPLALAEQVLGELNQTTRDGLSREMQEALRFLFTKCRRESAAGEVTYVAGISTIATAIGLSRDTKAVQLRVEPWLIKQGLLQVGHGGRALTNAGAVRASELLTEGS